MYEFFENGIRGGCAFVNKHHLKRNVPENQSFGGYSQRTELLYVDAVALQITILFNYIYI